MDEKYKKRISWDVECEQYTPLFPSDSGLPVSIYLDDGYAAVSSGHPTVVFVQNSYNHTDRTYKHLICLSVDDYVENIFNTERRIVYSDYAQVRRWIFNNQDLIRRLSHREIDIFGFLEEYRREKNKKKRFVAESEFNQLNEMATISGSFMGLSYAIWIDNGQTWRQSGHSPRIKIESTNRSKNTTFWNPFILSTMEFADTGNKDVKKYSAKEVSQIKEFVRHNLDFIKKVTCDEKQQYNYDEVLDGLVPMDEIRKNKSKKTIDDNIKKLVYINTIKGSTEDYIVVQDVTNDKYSLVSKRTDENVLNDRWFDSILPTIKQNGEKELIAVWDNEKVMYIQINKN